MSDHADQAAEPAAKPARRPGRKPDATAVKRSRRGAATVGAFSTEGRVLGADRRTAPGRFIRAARVALTDMLGDQPPGWVILSVNAAVVTAYRLHVIGQRLLDPTSVDDVELERRFVRFRNLQLMELDRLAAYAGKRVETFDQALASLKVIQGEVAQ